MNGLNQNVPNDDNEFEDQCSICLDSFTNKALAKDCLHNFCYQCIYSWVQHQNVCPLCLQPIRAIESKLNDTYYLESKNDPAGTLNAADSAEEEEVDEEEELEEEEECEEECDEEEIADWDEGDDYDNYSQFESFEDEIDSDY